MLCGCCLMEIVVKPSGWLLCEACSWSLRDGCPGLLVLLRPLGSTSSSTLGFAWLVVAGFAAIDTCFAKSTALGPVTLIGIAGTMGVILLSRFISIVKMQNKGEKLGTMSPMDQVLYRTHILEASLMSFAVFLGFIIDRTHDYLTKLDGLTSTKEEVERLQKEKVQLTEKEEKSSKEIKQLQEKIATLSEDLKKLKLECAEKDKAVETAESHVTSLQKQAADLLLEYDHLLEDNQKLQTQFAGHRR